MKGRRTHSQGRCLRCRIRKDACFCALIPELQLHTKLVVLMHARELSLTTNTARLAVMALPHSELRVRGQKQMHLDRLATNSDEEGGLAVSGRQSLFLYPSDEAELLTPELLARYQGPFTLIVPDGSWRQARKVGVREPALAGIPKVKLVPGSVSEYRLRREPHSEAVSTFEAIARALGVIEGSAVQQRLETLFRVMVERTLWSRGSLRPEDFTTEPPRVVR